MKYGVDQHSRRGRGLGRWLVIGAAVVAAFCVCSCTVKPKVVEAQAASYSGSQQNSGILELRVDDSGNTLGAVVDDTYAARWKELGGDPARLRAMEPGRWFADSEVLVDYMTKRTLQRSGRLETGK